MSVKRRGVETVTGEMGEPRSRQNWKTARLSNLTSHPATTRRPQNKIERMVAVAKQTYAQRATRHPNPAAKALLETIERKRTNLSVSVDVTKREDFFRIVDIVGPYVCLVKVGVLCPNG